MVISINKDRRDLEFISSIESRYYPFFGIEFHPEKNLYEWNDNSAILHNSEAIKASQYFANMFIDNTRKSLHKYTNLKNDIIWNYPVSYTGLLNSYFEQIYFFREDDIKRNSRKLQGHIDLTNHF